MAQTNYRVSDKAWDYLPFDGRFNDDDRLEIFNIIFPLYMQSRYVDTRRLESWEGIVRAHLAAHENAHKKRIKEMIRYRTLLLKFGYLEEEKDVV